MGRISPGPTRWPPGAKRHLVPAKSNFKPKTSVSEGMHLKRITRGRISWFELLLFIDVQVASQGNRPGPTFPVSIIPTLDEGHEVLRGFQACNKISTNFERKKVDVPPVSRRQACNPSDLLIIDVVGDLCSGNLIDRRQMNQVNWRGLGNYIVGVGPIRLAKSMTLL